MIEQKDIYVHPRYQIKGRYCHIGIFNTNSTENLIRAVTRDNEFIVVKYFSIVRKYNGKKNLLIGLTNCI